MASRKAVAVLPTQTLATSQPQSSPLASLTASSLTEESQVSVREISDLFGFPAKAVIAAIQNKRATLTRSFYTIPQLADRWNCSRATVYAVLAEAEFKVFDLRRKGKKKGIKNVPVDVVARLEQSRMREVAA